MLKSSSHFRWFVVALLFIISMLNYIDRAAMGYAITLIAQEYHYSEKAAGFILGAFGLGYMLSTFLGGIAADRFGAKNTLSISTVLWSFAIFFVGIAHTYPMFLLARILFGVAEGPNFPCASRAISDWLPEQERARAFTFSLIAVPLSLALGGIVIAWTINQIGWRHCFFYLSAITLLWVPLWMKFFQNQPQDSPYVNAQELDCIQQHSVIKSQIQDKQHQWRDLLTNKTLMSNNLSFFVFGFYLNFFMNWLPSYYQQAQHVAFKSLGLYNFLPWCCAAVLLWLVGTISDKIFSKTQNLRYARTYPIIITQSIAAICMFSIDFTHDFHWVLFFITCGVGFAISANAPFYAVNVDIAKERAGTALGIMTFGFSLAGILAPILTGYILDWTHRFDDVFYFMTILGLISIVNLFLNHNHD